MESIKKEYELPVDNINEFADLVEKLEDVDVNLCYQCRKCTSGCPLTDFMDYTPTQIIHAVRLGLKDLVLNSNTYQLCIACGMCNTRCPQETGLYDIMEALSVIARREGVKPKAVRVDKFFDVGMSNMRQFGRMYDFGVAAMHRLKTGNLTEDLGMGIKMFQKGKMELLPAFQNSKEMKKIFKKVEEIEKR